jgi:hypothetical protein
MDRHDNLAFSTAATSRQETTPELSDRDRDALHRMFNDMRLAVVGASPHRLAAVPHP